MKKKISKIVAVLLAVLMFITQALPVLALTEGNKYSYTEKYLNAYYNTGEWHTANGHTHDNYGQVGLRNLKSTDEPLYCIQIYNACNGADATAENIEDTSLWRNELSTDAKNGMTRVSIYGYPNYRYGYSSTEAQLATQVLLWEFEIGKRTQFSNTGTTGFAESIFENYPDAKKCYQEIIKACANHQKRPSFSNQTVELKGIGSNYSEILTDSNNILSNYTVKSSNDRIKASISGSKLTVYATGNGALEGDLIFTKNNTDVDTAFALTGAHQTLFYGTIADPVTTSVKVKLTTGNIKIVKSSEDGKRDFKFNVKGNDIDTTITTDAKTGIATLKDIPIGSYTVTEISQTPYVKNKAQIKTVNAGETTTFDFYNTLKKFKTEVNKEDIDVRVAQGDATLQGAEYGLYHNGQLVKTYVTDENGEFTTDYEICDDNWTLKEHKASEGYILDKTVYKIPADAKNFTLEHNTVKQKVTETPIKGKIAIIKHSDTCENQIETPEKGAEFQIYLKSKGSYKASATYERDVLVTDEYGFAETKDLPYGTYIVHQTKGLEGTEFVSDFEVNISKDKEIYSYLLNNRPFSSYIKIAKFDVETNKPITSSSAGYQIYDPDGNLVTMSFTYPTPTTIDTFYTNSEGYLVTPEKLPYGKGYKLVEVQAPYGYVLDSTPVEFDVIPNDTSEEDALTVVAVAQKNNAQKGIIEISKTGEIFTSVMNADDMYTPVYETQGLIGAEFELYAAEDIITGDGTLRAAKGELVDTIVTDSKGIAKSQPLYLGNYIVKETKAPYAFVLDETEYEVVLSYAGQEVDITSTELSLYNERQKSVVSLTKVLEQDELYKVGMNGEIENVKFGLYSADVVTAQDGSQIPVDGLITSANCDSEGNINFDCDLPVGFSWYVKEIETDKHYILSDEKYDFSTEYKGQDVQTIDIKINDGNAIPNPLKRYEIHGMKLDDSGNALAGAVIGIFKENTEKFTADTAVTTTISAEDGTFSFFNIPLGKYIVKEITAPDDYLIDPNNYVIDLTDNEQIVTLEIVNVLKRGNIQGTKVDDKGNALAGAVIGLFSADTTEFTEETALMTVISAQDGSFSFNDIPVGKYIVKELKAPKGYKLNDKNFDVELNENEQIVEIEIVNEAEKIEKKSPFTGAEDNEQFITSNLLLYAAGAALILSFAAAKRTKEQETNS